MATSTIQLLIERLEQVKSLGDATLEQLNEAQLHWAPNADSNSVAVIVQHLYGNMRSRFRDFLTSDGEKSDRQRDTEFEEQGLKRDEVLRRWDEGWDYVWQAIGPLTDADLDRTVLIRTEPHSVLEAILRQVSHYAYHVGQIVYLGKQLQGDEWRTLSIPRGRSEEYLKVPFKP